MTIEDIALQMTPGIGVKGAAHLLECFSTAKNIFSATKEDLIHFALLREDLALNLVRKKGFSAAEKELRYCEKNHLIAIASTDEIYPPLLREIPDYPHVLYVMGNPEVLSSRCLSIVGTRQATPYGQIVTSQLVEALSSRVSNLSIVSGLAFGIDVAAHRAALAAGVPTVAVLANALPKVMPSQHTDIARDIVEQGGTLISEVHSQCNPKGMGYLARNRIIAGLSEGCVVAESADHGGSLVTASYADGYNREVMAFPGRATDKTSRGTNFLIQRQKAHLILSAEDVLRELNWEHLSEGEGRNETQGKGEALLREERKKSVEMTLTREEEQLLSCFEGGDAVDMMELTSKSGFDPGMLSTLLIGLELSGAIKQLPGNRYLKLV